MPLVNDSNLATVMPIQPTVNSGPLSQILGMYGQFQNETPESGNVGLMRREFMNMLQGMMLPGRNEMRNMAARNITTQTSRDIRNLREGLAARGTLGAGAGANAMAELLRGQSNALSDVETNLNQMQTQYNQQNRGTALQGLMNLEQQRQSLFGTLLGGYNSQADRSLREYLGNRELDLKEQELDSGGGLGDLFGTILGGAVGAFTGGLGAGAGSALGRSIF